MAITATPFVYFLDSLGEGFHNFNSDHYWCALVSSYHQPNFIGENNFFFEMAFEQVPDASTLSDPGIDPYHTNGKQIANLAWAYDFDKQAQVLTGENCSWATLTGTFRYACVYRWSGVTADTDGKLVGLIDYGSDQTYAGTPFTVDFSDGIVSLAAA